MSEELIIKEYKQVIDVELVNPPDENKPVIAVFVGENRKQDAELFIQAWDKRTTAKP